ncbi:Cytochrome c oxidase subunit 5A [Tulasnella sp. 408]|nr:Cytochrome c oxidase subunit 5A [Tulasnella sp. 408]
MNTLRVARTLQSRGLASSQTLARAASTTTHTSAASSVIPVSNIEAQWETLSSKEQTEIYEQLLDAQKRDWKTLSIDEKKAAYYISFGPHGPRKPVDEPGSGLKVFGLTMAIVGAAGLGFAGIRSFGGEPPKTMTKEWQEASNEIAREEKQNPLTGLTSEGYKGKGHVSV